MVPNDHRDGPSGEVIALARPDSGQAAGDHVATGTRGLSTARAVLKVLSFMARHPEGVSARDVAQELGKSISTAYDLLASLSEERFAYHEPGHGYRLCAEAAFGAPASMPSRTKALSLALKDLLAQTHKRSYLARVEAGAIVITSVCGRQGIPRVPGLGPRISGNAHALAIGKVVLSLLPEHGRRRYVERGLRRYTPQTITSPSALMTELDKVRHNGFAIDHGEFDTQFCTIAAPILDARGHFVAVLGISTLMRTPDAEIDDLIRAVREMASAVGAGNARDDDLHAPEVRRVRAA
jgi:acetyl-CoA synthetase